jgi:hypothetical protein
MTIDHWLTIAIVISTLAGPTIAEYARPRINQPRANPEMSQPKNLIQRIGNWARRLLRTTWPLPALIVGLAIIALHRDVSVEGAITRKDVMRIALDVGQIGFGLSSWFVLSLLKIHKLSAELVRDHEVMFMQHFAITKEIVATIYPPPSIEDFEDYDPDQT